MIISNILLRTVPEHLMAGVSSGQLEVLGSIIRSTSSGKIVAHLQEAAPLANLLARAPLDLVIAPLDLAAQAIQIGQNEQIKAGIDALRELQTAGLVLNAASIGVSVAGFAMLNRKINALQADIGAVHSQLQGIDSKLDALWKEPWERDRQSLMTLAEKLDESWFLADGRGELADISSEAHSLANQFHRHAKDALESETFFLVAVPTIEAFAFASSIRVTARLAMDENKAALEASFGSAEKISALVSGIKPENEVLLKLQTQSDLFGTSSWTESLEDQRRRLIFPAARLRSMETSSATSAVTVESLIEHGISGRDWLEAAGTEEHSPLLVWEAGA
ncbi:MAG TPA: hypothetical protein DCF81_16930 [Erythrobacter sp.]|nr:hypothetical protein [Pseudomonadota bacterium]HAD18533.1 hypothetical protein [Erythrobacter sp.]|tara:strand:+ start:1023 stop:2027 length:1005 start_codon:yes stop_codon:yes gene_type:complete